MSLRDAVQKSKILTFAVMGAFVWLLLTLFEVVTSFNWYAISASNFVGETALGGIAGTIVLAIVLGVLTVLYSELTESDPTPNTWPPAE